MRLFLAIELEEELREHLVRVQEKIRPIARSASFTRMENLHLTLKFLGEVPEARVPALCAALEEVRLNALPRLVTEGIECFPEQQGPVRIVGAGVEQDGPLTQLHEAADDVCSSLGFAREVRTFRPHITLARAHRPMPSSVRERLVEAARGSFPGPEMAVEHFVAMESRLTRQGPEYRAIFKFYIKLP